MKSMKNIPSWLDEFFYGVLVVALGVMVTLCLKAH